MPILAYIAVILVSVGGILFEVNWLTSPKLETKAAVQVSAKATPPSNEVAAGPRNVAPTVTMVPGSAAASKPAEAAPSVPPQQTASAPVANPEPTATAAISPAPMGVASASTNAAALTPTETTGAGSTDFKREFTTDTKADSTTSSATFTPATAAAPPAAATPSVAASSNNKCDVASCAAAYQSFRVSDCSYQPIDGSARKMCDRTQGSAQQASVPAREKLVQPVARREASGDSKLRAFEREVRRITADEGAPDNYRYGRNQVIVIDSRD